MAKFMETARANRAGAAFGVLSVVVSLGAIVAAILLSEQFSWAANSLSDLGRASWESTAVFNVGLVVAGLLALPLGIILARNARTLLHAAGSVAFSLAAICLSLIGVFALPVPQHGTVAIGFSLPSQSVCSCTGPATCVLGHASAAVERSRWVSSMCSRG
jgi:hypothetical membrane protein